MVAAVFVLFAVASATVLVSVVADVILILIAHPAIVILVVRIISALVNFLVRAIVLSLVGTVRRPGRR